MSVRIAKWGLVGLVMVVSGGCQRPERMPAVTVRLGGAQVAVELVESWLREARQTSFLTQQVMPVYMSQHGFENLARGDCDIACTDRRITSREIEQFGDRKLGGHRVAFYGYALYVHPDNPLDAVFAGHLRLIFRKQINDWQALAGEEIPDFSGPINLYGPAKETRAGMILSPIANIWFSRPTWQVFETDQEIVDAVAADPYGLGFASIGYDQEARYLGLRMQRRARASLPSLEEIESEQYGLAKLIYVYYLDPPAPAIQAVLDQLFSEAGRASIEDAKLWAIPRARALLPTVP